MTTRIRPDHSQRNRAGVLDVVSQQLLLEQPSRRRVHAEVRLVEHRHGQQQAKFAGEDPPAAQQSRVDDDQHDDRDAAASKPIS